MLRDGEHDAYLESEGVIVYDKKQTSHGSEPKYLYHYTDRKSLAAITRKGGSYVLMGSRKSPFPWINNVSHGEGIYLTACPPQCMTQTLVKNNWCGAQFDSRTEAYFRFPMSWLASRGVEEVDHFCPGGACPRNAEYKSKSVWLLPGEGVHLIELAGVKGWKIGLRKVHGGMWQDFSELADCAWN